MDQSNRQRWTRARAVAALLASVLGLVYLILWLYNPARFRGDGEIRDTGFWSYPRYHIGFPEIPLDKPGEYAFKCSGLPPQSFTFLLRVSGGHEYDALKALRTNMVVRITDGSDRQVCGASGSLNQWELMWVPSDKAGAFYQRSCVDLWMNPCRTYSVNLSVSDVDPATPAVRARPVLEGGGIEGP